MTLYFISGWSGEFNFNGNKHWWDTCDVYDPNETFKYTNNVLKNILKKLLIHEECLADDTDIIVQLCGVWCKHIDAWENIGKVTLFPSGNKNSQKGAQRKRGDTGCGIKHVLFLFTAIPIASDRKAVAEGAQSDSNESMLLPIYRQISLTTTKNCGTAREGARRTAFGNR